MSTIINADTSDGLKFTSDTSGEIKLQSGGTDIATVDSSGITMASGKLLAPTGPAFKATILVTQNITVNTETKVPFDTVEFDTASCYDNTTNYRFTPNVAGYYQVNLTLDLRGTSKTSIFSYIFKNGTLDSRLTISRTATSAYEIQSGSVLVYMNGTTDYIEAYGYIDASANAGFGLNSQISANLVRAA
jgi:hypothetical protein